MKEFWGKLKEACARYQRYFQSNARSIANQNLTMARTVCLTVTVLLPVLFLLTSLFFEQWSITGYHLLFLVVMLTLYIVFTLYDRWGKNRTKVATLLCVLLQIVIFSFVLMIDVIADPTVRASFMSIISIALPAIFICPFWISYSIVFFFEICFWVMVCQMKAPAIAAYDIFQSVLGLLISVMVTQLILRLRMQDYDTHMKYKHTSERDALSGLLNKGTCEREVKEYLKADETQRGYALLILDLDDFKSVNDCFGHYAGDMLLHFVGEILHSTFYPMDIVGRVGGDEFMILVKECSDAQVLETLCARIRKRLASFSDPLVPERVTCSIGGVIVQQKNVDFESLYRQADAALYEAKRQGKDRSLLHHYQSVDIAE